MFNGLHYNSISSYLKERFGCKVVKLSLDAGLTCPNRDGTKGIGGCTFCSDSGSGDFAGTIEQQKASLSRKWRRKGGAELSSNICSTTEAQTGNICSATEAQTGKFCSTTEAQTGSICSTTQAQTGKYCSTTVVQPCGGTSLSEDAADKESPDLKYIAYFQNHTNTYAPVEKLRALWDEALDHENVVGLAIATRPDCLGPEVLDLLSEYNEKTFLWVELGLQTANGHTAEKFNRCWKNADFEEASYNLSTRGIKRVTHLIMGLPGEDKEQYISSAKYAASFDPFGIKIHMLHLMEGTAMGEEYKRQPFPLLTRDEYVSCVCDILEILPQTITVHRLTGDAPQDKLIAPDWTRNKHAVLNAVQQEFKRRGSYQGIRL